MQHEHFKYVGYGCDPDGTTYSTKGKRKAVIHNTGYQVISMYVNGKPKQLRAHRFIYECITGREIPSGMVINHIDGNKSNNAFSNLELVTHSENTKHALQIGLMKPCVGEFNGGATISADLVRNIIRDCMKGLSNKDIGSKYSLDPKHVSLIRLKKRWKFIFEEPEFHNYVIQFSPKSVKLSSELRQQLLEDLKHYTNKELSIKYNLDASTISRYRTKQSIQKSSTTIPNGSTLK